MEEWRSTKRDAEDEEDEKKERIYSNRRRKRKKKKEEGNKKMKSAEETCLGLPWPAATSCLADLERCWFLHCPHSYGAVLLGARWLRNVNVQLRRSLSIIPWA
ncbi:Hypothetical protein SMAX5B_002599 [Scophthalmus maximus]|uniref:Uncharacterized protein n=1 Tax=Scophthalmus maximus TaxID=52904 RepID=A0A2U9BYR1_SCOMX|nr:Hypothetical protein SMAX5B_002599 [Scophthalmus maximus]